MVKSTLPTGSGTTTGVIVSLVVACSVLVGAAEVVTGVVDFVVSTERVRVFLAWASFFVVAVLDDVVVVVVVFLAIGSLGFELETVDVMVVVVVVEVEEEPGLAVCLVTELVDLFVDRLTLGFVVDDDEAAFVSELDALTLVEFEVLVDLALAILVRAMLFFSTFSCFSSFLSSSLSSAAAVLAGFFFVNEVSWAFIGFFLEISLTAALVGAGLAEGLTGGLAD